MGTKKAESFVARLKEKRALLEAGDSRHEKIRTASFIGPGGMRGVYGAGVCLGLHHLNFAHCFDWVFGDSTGAAAAVYSLSGAERARQGATTYLDECLSPLFCSLFPLSMDMDYLESVLRKGQKRVDVAAVMHHRSRLFVVATRWDDGACVLLDAKTAQPDMVAAVKASMALTSAYPWPVVVNGERYTDGGMSEALPIEKMVALARPTDMLFVSNYSRRECLETGFTFLERLMDRLAWRIPSGMKKAFRERNARTRDNAVLMEHLPMNKAILWAGEEVGLLTRNKAKLRAAMEKGIRDCLALFGDTETLPETIMP